MRIAILLLFLLALASFSPCAAGEPDSSRPSVPVYGYRVRNAYPHDRAAFTQGLVLADGVLYEGTGLHASSSIRRVDLESGTVLQRRTIPDQYFGEGVAVFGDKIIQLTWRSGVALVYDRESLELLRLLPYPAEGWGLTSDSIHLIASDGTATLRFLDPETLREVRRLTVVDQGEPVALLNELEYVAGRIFANVWQSERIAIINPADGRVTGWLDLRGLLSPEERAGGADVLNGIAYDPRSERLYVTGKLWPRLFWIDPLLPPETQGGRR